MRQHLLSLLAARGVLVLFVAASAGCGAASNEAGAQGVGAAKGPQDQLAFVRVVTAARDAYDGTDNELKQLRIQQQRNAALCMALPGGSVSNWVGTLKDVSLSGGGRAVVGLVIGDRVKVGTWNNVFSDRADRTLIGKDTRIYNALVEMEPGDEVRFSGTIIRAPASCFRERSLTSYGRVRTPNFIIRFSQITPVARPPAR